MKKFLLFMLASMTLLVANATSGKYLVKLQMNPKIAMGPHGDMVSLFVSSEDGLHLLSKSLLKEGKAEFVGQVASDSLAYIQFGDNEKFRIPFVLESGEITIDQDGNTVQAHGTPLNDRLLAYYSEDTEPWTDSTTYVRKTEERIIKNRDNSLAAMLFLGSMYVKENDLKVTETYWQHLSPRIQKIAEVNNLYQRVIADSRCYEGMMLKDAELLEGNEEAKKVHLSDYIGKGQYVLVDLWASWCTACRMGIPHVKAAYAAFKDKGLECVSIAVWDKRDAALRAIQEEKMPWTQLVDEKGVLGTLYGFNFIPLLYLFSPDGHLLKKDIPNDQLMEVLEQVLEHK